MERVACRTGLVWRPVTKLAAVFLCCALCLAGCRLVPPRPTSVPSERPPDVSAAVPPKSTAAAPSPVSTAGPYPDRAYVLVQAIEVSAPFVRRNEPFTVKLRIGNLGGRAAESFEVQAQANLDRRSSVQSFPIGGRNKLGLKPSETTEIALIRSEGLPHVGIYTITVDLLLTEWEPVEDTDRVNPRIPPARIVVTD